MYNRGVDRQDIFSKPDDFVVFQSLMGDWALREGVQIHAFVLMTNHFHVLVHVPDGGMSTWMHRTAGAYSTWYNQQSKRTGPLFTGRYNSIPILGEAQMIGSARYIHRNPLDVVSVAALPAYAHSSLGAYLGKWPAPEWLRTDALSSLSDVRRLADDITVADFDDRRPFEMLPPSRSTSVAEVEAACAVAFAGQPTLQRTIGVAIAVELRVSTIDELALRHGVDPSTIRRRARRGRVLLDSDPSFDRARHRIAELLDAA